MSQAGVVSDIRRRLFKLRLVRVMVALFFLIRGTFFLLVDPFRGISDFCWIYRVSQIDIVRNFAYHTVSRYLVRVPVGPNRK